jgi:tRNA threonylcarbamoyladenosine biosynthesis protein TsaE
MANPRRLSQNSFNISQNPERNRRTKQTFTSTSAANTRKLGKEFASRLKPGDVVCLIGELGSGKTTFVQGLLGGFGIKGYVRSSSFIIVNQYTKRSLDIFHIDLYRLSGQKDFESFGLEEYIGGKGICLIEWADKISRIWTKSLWNIKFKWLGDTKRKIEIKKQ